MEKPLVSIALCTYNGAKFLVEQLDSIIHQTYSNLEIIAVDDRSSDQTLSILKSYADRFQNFKIQQNEVNLGYVKNFEKTISLCNGEFIALADQDDIWLPNKIELQVNEIGKHILVYHDSEFIDDEGKSMDKKVSDVRQFYTGNDSRYFLFENCVSGHTVLFNKKLIPYLQDFPKEIIHDWWMVYVATNIGSIDFLNEPLVKYRQHSTACTDILRQKQQQKEDRDVRSKRFIDRIRLFTNYPFNTQQKFKSRLLHLLENSKAKKTNLNLFFFILTHKDILLFMQKKGFWSKLNYCRKFL